MAELTPEQLSRIVLNPNFDDKELLVEISELFKDKPEAVEYLYLYGELCEVMDDLVDEVYERAANVDKAGLLRCQLSTCPYWLRHWQSLWLLERLVHHQYRDVVTWEHSTDEWKRRDAKALSHCAYNMLFAVVLLEFGDETLKTLSERFRTHAHLRHINDKI